MGRRVLFFSSVFFILVGCVVSIAVAEGVLSADTRPFIEYDGRITFGNILSLVSMLVSVIVLWVKITTRIAVLERTIEEIPRIQERIEKFFELLLKQASK